MRTISLGLLLWLAWGATLFIPTTDQTRVRVGEASPKDIKAPYQVTYISEVETERARNEAAARVPEVYRGPDQEIIARQLQHLDEVLAYIATVREDTNPSPQARDNVPHLTLSEEKWNLLRTLSDTSWETVMRESKRVLSLIMRDEIRPEDLVQAKRDVQRLMLPTLSNQEREAVTALVLDLIVVNTFVDEARTEALRAEARANVSPVIRTIQAGEAIVREGEIVSPLAYEKLQVLGLLAQGPNWAKVGSQLALSLLIIIIGTAYIARTDPLLLGRPRRQFLLTAVLICVILAARFLIPGRMLLPYLFPGAAAAMLIALFMDLHYATLIAFATALIIGTIGGDSFPLALYVLLGSLVGALALAHAENLGTFIPATGYLAAINIGLLLLYRFAEGNYDLIGLLQLIGTGALNAVISTSLCFIAYAFTGRLFGITTALQLMELSRPTHPLFRQLLINAPGTYHHSILISNVAERAAEAIGADALLTRVGAYYHDVGKILRPHFFAENQTDGQNPHDKLDPKTSAEIIIGHVRDGLELARRYRLPEKVQAFIAEHHGTTLVTYFYRRANQTAEQEVNEDDFRYPGPKPQSKETAILMLADAVEAWIRAEHPPTEAEMERVIRQVINDRLISGQLDESDLTLRDLDRIRQAFASVLRGLYHPRIQYPARTSGQRGQDSTNNATNA